MNDKYIVDDIEIYYGDYKDENFDNTYVQIYVLEYDVSKHASETLREIEEERYKKFPKLKK